MKRLLTLLLAFPALLLALAVSTPASAPGADPTYEFRGIAPWDGKVEHTPYGYSLREHDLGSFEVPEIPAGMDADAALLRWKLQFERSLFSGGQNLSAQPTPALDPSLNSVGYWLHLYHADQHDENSYVWDGEFTTLITGEPIRDWPALEPGTHPIPAEDWPEMFERGEPSVYWGGGISSGPSNNGPFAYGGVVTQASATPGETIDVVLHSRWDADEWPTGHAWPYDYQVPLDIVISMEWVERN